MSVDKNTGDIANYIQTLGQQARQASRAMAKADTATKNQALLAIATAIRREAPASLRAANELRFGRSQSCRHGCRDVRSSGAQAIKPSPPWLKA